MRKYFGIHVTGLAWLSDQNAHVNEPFDSALQTQTRRCSLHACEQHSWTFRYIYGCQIYFISRVATVFQTPIGVKHPVV